jgi:hypothetical protein
MGDVVDYRTKLCLLKWQRGHDGAIEAGAAAEGGGDVLSEITERLTVALEDPLFAPVAAALLHAWRVARCKLGESSGKRTRINDRESLELASKFTKFLCPALSNISRLKVTDAAYRPPYTHLLEPDKVDAMTKSKVTLFDVSRSKTFGARVIDKSTLWPLEDTLISLQHMDPTRTRKLVQRYENLPTNVTPHISSDSASLLHLVALGSPDWDLTSFKDDAPRCGWSGPEIEGFSTHSMISPLAIALTWLVDKTDDPAVMFYYDSPVNNGGLQSESGNRSGCGVKLLRDSFELVNLATWVAAGQPAEGSPAAHRWSTEQELTIEDFQRTLAAVSILIKVDPKSTGAAMSVFFSQARGDPVGAALRLGGVHSSGSVPQDKPTWPPGITATAATVAARQEFASEAHCRRILGDTNAEKILGRSRQCTHVTECDQRKYTHRSLAHIDDNNTVFINPGELPRLLPPWQNPAVVDPRHAVKTRRQTRSYITPRGHNERRNAPGRRREKRDCPPNDRHSRPRM